MNSFAFATRIRCICLVAVVLCTSACGQIGPLYLPEETPEPPAAETSDDEKEQQDSP